RPAPVVRRCDLLIDLAGGGGAALAAGAAVRLRHPRPCRRRFLHRFRPLRSPPPSQISNSRNGRPFPIMPHRPLEDISARRKRRRIFPREAGRETADRRWRACVALPFPLILGAMRAKRCRAGHGTRLGNSVQARCQGSACFAVVPHILTPAIPLACLTQSVNCAASSSPSRTSR